jgi:cystathionine beta-lyase
MDLDWLRTKQGVKWRRFGAEVIPAWLADMDFPPAQVVSQAVQEVVDGADLGYPGWAQGTPLRALFAERMAQRHGWVLDPTRVRETNEVVQGTLLALMHGTSIGDVVAIHTPTYPPFQKYIPALGRLLLPIPMADVDGGWACDLARLDRDVASTRCRALVLVNPHNPTGRVFAAEELDALAHTARRHDLLVIADEIHSDLVYAPHRHIPFASLPGMGERTVTLNSASKGFNLAGVRCAIAHLGPERLRASWDNAPSVLYTSPNIFGVAATLAAWQHGDTWLTGVLAHLDRQRHLLIDSLARLVPGARHHLVQAGYLAWIDFRATGLGPDPAATLLDSAKVALQSGVPFVTDGGGEGFARLNFATSPDILREIINRISHVAGADRDQH